ncbi:leucine-rich repeat domain-containing protein [Promethearchaeum syntrophicum]|uniref:Leucine-rich repeat domain-containing protein n=1 Tax=Promethearchaeum syntrophicum TaxID=2594042 RepID=A0A5B9DBC6_9ARCH|nr:leucine-rich repeat domain-containing protein [Candidatus Prometheoarchaeum syntrophicum]QEE16549.1 Leucine Rich repeats (2 copies) [Candidatus Prometheoarchaeum syntrophicum]
MSQILNENDRKTLNSLGSPVSSQEIKEDNLYLSYYIENGDVDTIILWGTFVKPNTAFGHFQLRGRKKPNHIRLTSYDNTEILKLLTCFHHLGSLHFFFFFESTDSLELIGNLKYLRKLSITNDNSIKLPNSLEKLSNLTDLAITITEKPFPFSDSLKNLQNLEKFHIGTDLKKFPEFVLNFKKLKSLSLASNSLLYIPPSIGDLRNLQKLNLYNNKISSLPHTIENLQNLTHINIARNNFTTIPEYIKNLKNLKSIDIDKNPFVSLESFKFLYSNRKLIINGKQSIGSLNIPKKIKNLWFDGKYDEIMQYYTPPITEIAQKYAQDPKSLTGLEFERLETEATNEVRDILELSLPKDDSMLKIINDKLKFGLRNGLKLMR